MPATHPHSSDPSVTDVAVAELTTAEAIESLVAEQLAGEFRVVAPLGWGRWGVRFRAEDLRRGDAVILTALPPLTEEERGKGLAFLDALKTASLLDHPHLDPICAYGLTGPLRWFALPASDDATLADHLARNGPLSLPAVRRIGQQLASALDQAHRRGISHGALTDAEVLIAADGWVRVQEIGILAAVTPPSEEPDLLPYAPRTAPGEGPDQLALATILHQCLTGGSAEAPLPVEVPSAVEAAFRRAARVLPRERFRDLLDLVGALDGPLTGPTPLRPTFAAGEGVQPGGWEQLLKDEFSRPTKPPRVVHPGIVAAAAGVLLFSAVALTSWLRSDTEPDFLPPAAAESPSQVAVRLPAEPAPAASHQAPRSSPPRRNAARVTPPPRRSGATPLPPPPASPVVVVPGSLSISSRPWGEVAIDGHPLGNTPQIDLPLAPGRHHVRVSRDGYVPFETWVDIAPGTASRLTEIALRELAL
jgi:hypothetical protein